MPIAIFGFLGDVVDAVVCLMVNIGYAVAWGIAQVINIVIIALGAVVGFVLGALPVVPTDWTELPAWLMGPVNYFLPTEVMLYQFGGFLTCYVVWLLYRVLANWVKVS